VHLARTISRRSFLEAAASVPLAGVLAHSPLLAGSPTAVNADVLFPISLAEWSLHRALGAGTLDHLDFPRAAARDYGLDAVEYVNTFFGGRGADRAYLADLKARCEGEGVKSLGIRCGAEGAIGDPDDEGGGPVWFRDIFVKALGD
jgi:L-ribulose-5-phosphate 3-epimerase